ncbi:hypothetical protein K438DRAFT_1851070 [Mycena galopus ATCC 62051]|nr:hypothetical protein K438DRAFT_1851070 [Mycena galopus ATCC 62051]
METQSFDDLRDCLSAVYGGELQPDRVDGWEVLSGPHPILQLPPEILSEIFIQCLPTYSATPSSTRAPMLLATICRDWREIALSTPYLWCSFILSVDLIKTRDESAIIRLFETWLSRGGGCPLTMVINGVSSVVSAQHTLPPSFISALNQSSSRWHDVNLLLPFNDFYRLQANEGLTLLRRLSITATANTAPVDLDSPLLPLNLFSTAPVLQDISLGHGFTIDNVTLPLHQLTYFDSRVFSTGAHYLEVARAAPGLQEIRLALNTSGRWSPRDPVRSNIKSLHLSMREEYNDMLDCVTFPALETLVIRTAIAFYPPPFTPFDLHRFFARSSPPLRELVVEGLPYLSDALVQTVPCLTALPTLETLDIRPVAGETAHNIFNRMSDPTSTFLPRLQIITVQVNIGEAPGMPWTYDTMTRMLVARWNQQAGEDVDQLQAFSFGFSLGSNFGQPDSTTIEQLEKLCEQGMDIELSTN